MESVRPGLFDRGSAVKVISDPPGACPTTQAVYGKNIGQATSYDDDGCLSSHFS